MKQRSIEASRNYTQRIYRISMIFLALSLLGVCHSNAEAETKPNASISETQKLLAEIEKSNPSSGPDSREAKQFAKLRQEFFQKLQALPPKQQHALARALKRNLPEEQWKSLFGSLSVEQTTTLESFLSPEPKSPRLASDATDNGSARTLFATSQQAQIIFATQGLASLRRQYGVLGIVSLFGIKTIIPTLMSIAGFSLFFRRRTPISFSIGLVSFAVAIIIANQVIEFAEINRKYHRLENQIDELEGKITDTSDELEVLSLETESKFSSLEQNLIELVKQLKKSPFSEY